MQHYFDRLTDAQAQAFAAKIEEPFKKLPHLPEGITNFFATIAPWLVGLGGLLNIVSGLSSILNSGNMGMFGWVAPLVQVSPAYFVITGVLQIIVGVISLAAFNPLRERALRGWMLVFWTTMLGVVQSVVAIAFNFGNIVGVIIGTLIGFYILFEMKREYKK
ncbi:MAG TPA: hypothetical protein VF209_03625 [Patescibacteria group bacterium]